MSQDSWLAARAHAIPFGHNNYYMWLRPGQRGLPRKTVRVGSGTVGGAHWSVTGYAGPWGLCFTDTNGGGYCPSGLSSRLSNGALAAEISCGGGPPQIATGQAAAAVSYLRVKLSDGSVRKVPTTWLAGRHYFAFAMPPKLRWESYTAYGASGQRLGSGNAFAYCYRPSGDRAPPRLAAGPCGRYFGRRHLPAGR